MKPMLGDLVMAAIFTFVDWWKKRRGRATHR